MEKNQYECTNVPSENNIYFDFMDILDNYENLYESNYNDTIEKENVMLQKTNQKKLSDLLSKYLQNLNMMQAKLIWKPPKIFLTSELPISFRVYRTFLEEEAKIKEQVKKSIRSRSN